MPTIRACFGHGRERTNPLLPLPLTEGSVVNLSLRSCLELRTGRKTEDHDLALKAFPQCDK